METSEDDPRAALDALWDFGDPAGSERRFRAFAEAHAGDPALHAEALTQAARAQGLAGAFDVADATLDAVAARLDEGPSRARARLELERGRVRNSAGDREAARPRFEAALEAARAAGEDALALDAIHMLGIACEPADALAWNARGVALAEASDDPAVRRWLGPLHHNTGMVHLEAGDPATARTSFEAGRAFRASVGDVPGERIGRWCVAHCLRLEGRLEEALAMQLALEAELAADPDAAPDGYVHEELAALLDALGRADEAAPHHARAEALLHPPEGDSR